MKMKKFLSLLALLAFTLILGAKGLDPPRDHTPQGYEIVICDAIDQAGTITILEEQAVCLNAERTWQPPGVLYESCIITESVYPYPPNGEMQQNSQLILQMRYRLSDLQSVNLNNSAYRKTKFLMYNDSWVWNYSLFRCDRTMYV